MRLLVSDRGPWLVNFKNISLQRIRNNTVGRDYRHFYQMQNRIHEITDQQAPCMATVLNHCPSLSVEAKYVLNLVCEALEWGVHNLLTPGAGQHHFPPEVTVAGQIISSHDSLCKFLLFKILYTKVMTNYNMGGGALNV